MPDAPDVRPPDSDEPSELREKLEQLDIAPTPVLKEEIRTNEGRSTSRMRHHDQMLQTMSEDIVILKRAMPRDLTCDVNDLKNTLRGIPTHSQVESKVNSMVKELGKTEERLQQQVDARPTGEQVRHEVARETSKVDAKRARDTDHLALMAAAVAGNAHFYCAAQAMSVLTTEPHYDIDILVVKENVARKVFTATNGTNTINCAAHGLANWQKITGLKNTGGALPTGLSDQIYYAMSVADDTFQLTTDKPGTASPTAVTFSDDGTGTHKFVYVTSIEAHEWMDLEPVVSIADTIVAYNLVYDSVAPETEDLRWRETETEKPRVSGGQLKLRVYLPSAPQAAETATVTVKIASDDKLIRTVASMDVVATFA